MDHSTTTSNEAMNTELKRIHFLLEAEAELALARDTKDNIDAARDLPPYVTNYIGSKQKLVDWIWCAKCRLGECKSC